MVKKKIYLRATATAVLISRNGTRDFVRRATRGLSFVFRHDVLVTRVFRGLLSGSWSNPADGGVRRI